MTASPTDAPDPTDTSAPEGPHELDVLLDAATAGEEVDVPAGWGQGRATFGGLVAGAMTARTLGATGLDPSTLRAVTTSFVAPTVAGPARLRTRVLRQGSSATQVEVHLEQVDDRTGEATPRAVLLAAYGADRDSAVELAPAPSPTPLPALDGLLQVPHLPGMTPDFFAHVDLRLASGEFPYSGATSGSITGWMRFRRPPAALTVPHLVALVDAWPPAPGQCLPTFAQMSTLTWTLELLATPDPDPGAFLWYAVDTDAAHRGYAHSHAQVRTASGELVAISRQTIALFG